MRKFKKVYIEITNVCNLKCSFCPSTKRAPEFMNVGDFVYIIHETKPFSDYVYFHLMGEPLLNPNLESLLKVCFDNSIKVNITTNGTLLHKSEDILLNAPALRKVSVSLHSFEANANNYTLCKYINDVVGFINNAIQRGIICELRLWNMDSGVLKGNNNLNSEILKRLEEAFHPEFDLAQAIESQANIKLKDRLFIHRNEMFEWPDIDRKTVEEEAFCYGLRDQFGILADGTVVPCCLDSEGNIPLGNVFERPLKDILSSKRACRIYEGFSKREAVEELCRKCGYAKRHRKV